jgi:hypothetical protein
MPHFQTVASEGPAPTPVRDPNLDPPEKDPGPPAPPRRDPSPGEPARRDPPPPHEPDEPEQPPMQDPPAPGEGGDKIIA